MAIRRRDDRGLDRAVLVRAHVLRQIVLVRNPIEEPGVTDGFLSFGDGSFLQVRLSSTDRQTVVPISPRSADRLRFTASDVSTGARHVAIAEIIVSSRSADEAVITDDTTDGNVASVAVASQSDGSRASDPRLLQDGAGGAGAKGLGQEWTASEPAGAWVQLDWGRPQELSSIEIVGSRRSATALEHATLIFADGVQLPIGEVLSDPARPTIVSFMPRVTTSVRLRIDGTGGAGSLILAELRVYQRGSTPVRSSPDARALPPPPSATGCGAPAGSAPDTGLQVRCPTTGSVVAGSVSLQVATAPGYSSVTATVWPADELVPAGPSVAATPDGSGTAVLTLDVSGTPPGPLTVDLEATGPGQEAARVFFPLYRGGAAATEGDLPSSAPAGGRTLAYAEEFDRPLSLSRTGADADYAAAKPTHDGAQDFGDAGFADPARGVDNVRVVDDRYLRIDVTPSPPGYGNGAWLGGLLASARQGGSGFSAQYGYFEARMLVPAAPGTWPAFWMLPNDNLIAPQPVVAEIDAAELYGHDPKGACHSTHEYKNGKDGGKARCGQRFGSERDALAWHTYGVSITPTDITFYIDGSIVATAPQVDGGGAPMFFLVNLALGGGWPVELGPIQDRATLYVDYVRVYV